MYNFKVIGNAQYNNGLSITTVVKVKDAPSINVAIETAKKKLMRKKDVIGFQYINNTQISERGTYHK